MGIFDNGLYASDWSLYTSEDYEASLLVLSGGFGALYAKNDKTGEDVKIRMHFFGGGPSVGLPANIGKSEKDYPSGGVGKVGVKSGHTMWGNDFAGRGWILQMSATAGFLGSIAGKDYNGAGLAIIYFGMPPFHKAIARMWSTNKMVAPSAGFAAYAATFYVDD